ncbi:MAG: D-2-hydroxyacid dehydrogenase [Oscillospiraceae bacterium]|nr:D-2-hydroxyacid dehydrogenase [Oscillospiraceae bacterium]
MRRIAVCANFINETHRRRIDEAAERAGFSVSYFETQAALGEEIAGFEVLFGYIPPSLLAGAKSLRWLCAASAGVDHLLEDSLWPHPGCLLSNSSGAYGPAISEHIIMVLLMLLRRMPAYQAALSRREWPCFTPIRAVTGSHILLLGTGDIGSNTARRLKALGARVTGVCRSGRSDEPAFDRVLPLAALDGALPDADALVLALPATPETAGVLSRARIALLPERAFVVNVGRGSAIDQEALVEALQAGQLAGAALDVMTPEPLPMDHPLWSCPNVVLTPHVSGNMALGLTCDLDVEMFCGDLARYAAGEPLEHLVDRKRGY